MSDPDRFVDEDISDEDYADMEDELTVPVLECTGCSNRDINQMRFAEVNVSADYYFIREYDSNGIFIDATGKGGDVTTESTHIYCLVCGTEFPVPEGMEPYL